MAFCGRAKRETFHLQTTTPYSVGPGSYTDAAAAAAAARKSEHGFAPFNTTSHRAPIEDVRCLPGPGQYLENDPKEPAHPFFDIEHETGNFASTSSRFHVDKATSILSPGPGTYVSKNVWIKNKHRYQSDSPQRRVEFNRVGTVPSVPARDQSFGYEEDDAGSLIMQPPPFRGHSGFGQDSVGPGEYSPNMASVKISKTTNFGASKSRRTEWKDKKTPGPGMYQGNEGNQKENLNYLFQEGNQSSSFVSRTKMLHQKVLKQHECTPGPGSYSASKVLGPKRSRSVPRSMQFFGSTQNRSFQQDPSKMHAAPMIYKTPGPGMYDYQKKAATHPEQPNSPQPRSGFNQSSTRFNPSDTPVPGPGNYGIVNDKSIAGSLKSKVVSRGGAFGSSSARSDPQVVKSVMHTPGPGNYAKPLTELNQVKGHVSHMFASKSSRFRSPKGPTALDYTDVEDPEDKPRGDPSLLGPGAYNIQDGWSGCPSSKMGQLKQPGFSSSSDRFRLMGSREHAPGPGEYDALKTNAKPLSRLACGFVTKESRFKAASTHVPGPGHYHPEHVKTMINRSYNVSVEGHLSV